jgi:hypothetical protein
MNRIEEWKYIIRGTRCYYGGIKKFFDKAFSTYTRPYKVLDYLQYLENTNNYNDIERMLIEIREILKNEY